MIKQVGSGQEIPLNFIELETGGNSPVITDLASDESLIAVTGSIATKMLYFFVCTAQNDIESMEKQNQESSLYFLVWHKTNDIMIRKAVEMAELEIELKSRDRHP